MVITLFGLKNKKLSLAFDYTNWKFGLNINILMLTVAYKGIGLIGCKNVISLRMDHSCIVIAL